MNACRTCLRFLYHDNEGFAIEDNNFNSIRGKLVTLIPELNLEIFQNSVICVHCSEVLNMAYDFRINCLENEQTIKNYRLSKESNNSVTFSILEIAHGEEIKVDVKPIVLGDPYAPSTSATDIQLKPSDTCSSDEHSSDTPVKEYAKCRNIVDGKFFKLVPRKSNSSTTVAICVRCEPKKVELRGSASSSSNFLSHLKRKHGNNALNEYKSYVAQKNSAKKQKALTTLNEVMKPNLIKKLKFPYTQTTFENKIRNFIVHALVPLQVVDDPYFTDIFEHLQIADYGLKVVNRRTLGSTIDGLYVDSKEKLKTILSEVVNVCTTADIWYGNSRSILGVTVHWIDSTCNRKSAALACRRFRNPVSKEKISELLSNIYTDYNINYEKICATITDNGSNYVKVFKEFGVKKSCMEKSDDMSIVDDAISSTDSEDDLPVSQLKETHTTINSVLPFFANHLQCCAQTLNSIVSLDLMNLINSSQVLLEIHETTINKCNILWKATTQPKSAEIIENLLGFTLPRPCNTRWNSLYDALKKLLEIGAKSSLLFEALNVADMFSIEEIKYLNEHLQCTKPIADALDILQEEKFAYYGVLIPTLVSLKRKLENLSKFDYYYCKPIIHCLLVHFNRRFSHILTFSSTESINAAIAAFAHPEFKNRWLPCIPQQYHSKLLTAFKDSVSAEILPKLTNENESSRNFANRFF